MKKIFTLLFSCIFCMTAFAQTPNVLWNKYIETTYSGMEEGEAIYDAKLTADKGFILVGYDTGLQYNKPTLWNKTAYGVGWIVKTDGEGTILWHKKPNLIAGAYTTVEQTSDQGFVVAGYGTKGNFPAVDMAEAYILRLAGDGTVIWNRSYGGDGLDRPYAVKQTSDGGYIIAGNTNSTNGDITTSHGGSDAWLLKLDANGNKEWSLTYGGTGNDTAYDVIQLPDNGFMVTGTSSSADGDLTANKGSADAWLFKVNAAGTLQWQKNLGGNAQDVLNNIFRNNDDTYTLSGYSWSNNGDVANNHGEADVWLLKTDNAGNIIWSKLYGGTKDDAVFDLSAGPGGFWATGFTESADGNVSNAQLGGANFWTIWFDHSGELIWERSTGTPKNEWSYAIVPLANNDFLLAGIGEPLIPQFPDYGTDGLIMKLAPAVNTIKGTLFLDNNSNGIKDPGENYFDDAKVTSQKSSYAASAVPYNGLFVISADTGTYTTTIRVSNLYFTVVPASRQSVFTTYHNTDSLSFAVQPLPLKKDLVMHIVPAAIARPGFNATYQLIYENAGTMSVPSGTVKMVKDSRTTFVTASPAPTVINADTLQWDFTGLAPLTSSSIILTLGIAAPPTVNFGDMLAFTAVVGPVDNDETPGDDTARLRQQVRGSYDPNDKTESNGGVITPAQVNDGEYLNYLIRFQNTGTDTAFNVIIRDTLDAQLDWNSLQMVTASHAYQLSITDNNKLSWSFNNILLADSNINEPASHGYIAYRIKPLPTVVVGDTIRNTAGIYFDFNVPVATNMEITAIVSLATLPVDLASFKAVLNGGAVNISWKTATESNTDLFEVQRSTNGKDFITIGTVQAKNVATGASYAFKDETPAAGYNYYRLNTVDINRSSKLSSIVMVNVKAGADLVASIYPNPTGGEVTVDIKGDNANDVSVSVIDQAGRSVLTRLIARQSGSRTMVPLSLGRLSKGLYTLRVTAGKHTSTHQLLVR